MANSAQPGIELMPSGIVAPLAVLPPGYAVMPSPVMPTVETPEVQTRKHRFWPLTWIDRLQQASYERRPDDYGYKLNYFRHFPKD